MSNKHTLIAGRWRTAEEVHAMARYSVKETLKQHGPMSREGLVRKTGLAELNAQRAIRALLETGDIATAGSNRVYLP